MRDSFLKAEDAFEYFYNCISKYGVDFADTKALFNVGFNILNPHPNNILTPFRKWSEKYAKAEWQWYLTGDSKVERLGKIYGKVPKIWERMADEHGEVNSNYGYQWDRHQQLDKVIAKLKSNPNTRQAVISIYDGKEICNYKHDTPCTTAIQFTILNNQLNMCVTMRSNDLWYGFCNDQYCFSELHKLVSEWTGYEQGSYYHFAHNLHLYKRDLNKAPKAADTFLQRRSDYYK
jgi:thymidylate synthase